MYFNAADHYIVLTCTYNVTGMLSLREEVFFLVFLHLLNASKKKKFSTTCINTDIHINRYRNVIIFILEDQIRQIHTCTSMHVKKTGPMEVIL